MTETFKEVARLRLPVPIKAFVKVTKALDSAYPNAFARQEGEWLILEVKEEKQKTDTNPRQFN